METSYQTTDSPNKDIFDQPRKGLPGMLNVLTILTFIGCGLSYISTAWGFYDSGRLEEKRTELENLQDQSGDNEMVQRMMQGALEVAEKSYEYRYIILLSGILFTTLCLIGAMQMRKLKKSGYNLYVIGEIAPVLLMGFLIGFNFTSGIAMVFGAIVAVIFVILYSTQRKYLVN